MSPQLKAPFPWFGGKSRAAPLIWKRFGDVQHLIIPFFGSGAELWGRPKDHIYNLVTANDINAYLCNVWRALDKSPKEVAAWAHGPVFENDLHARHRWLIAQGDNLRIHIEADPDFYDVKIAGWWIWGISAWIGGEWCKIPKHQRPHLSNAGDGVHRSMPRDGFVRKRPHLSDAGNGVHRQTPQESERNNTVSARLAWLEDWFSKFPVAMERTRVCCGDWKRILTPSVLNATGAPIGIILDPPYSVEAGRFPNLYSEDEPGIADNVRYWCLHNCANQSLRIAICGYDTEHEELASQGWQVVEWKASGGLSKAGKRGLENRHRERIWFSPHCLNPDFSQLNLF